MSKEILNSDEIIKDVLPFEIKRRSLGRPIQVVSDFDGTLCSTHSVSQLWQTHVPHIKTDLSKAAKRLINPICIATARSGLVPWIIWHRLSNVPMPLITENGAVLTYPSTRISELSRTEILATTDQIELMREIQKELKAKIKIFTIPPNNELILRSERIATIELRLEEKVSKKGAPEYYDGIIEQLKIMFSDRLSLIDIVKSGSSLGIQPEGINKESGIKAALVRAGLEEKNVFFIGLGDNENDIPLFNFVKQKRGLTIGIGLQTQGMCEFSLDRGAEINLEILKILNQLEIT